MGSGRALAFPEIGLGGSMNGPVEEREPMADERRLDGIVEDGLDRLVRALALEEEDDLGLREEDDVPHEGVLELRSPERRMLGEELLRPRAGVRFQAGDENEALHGREKPTLPAGAGR